MATSTGLWLPLWLQANFAAFGNAGVRVHDPGRPSVIIKIDVEALRTVFRVGAYPLNVFRAGSVASLAADTNFRVGRIKRITGGIKPHLKMGRMTLGAHVIPVLLQTSPVQFVIRRNVLVGILMKPALTAFGLRPRVPGKRERLQATTGEFDQILLQWLDAKCIGDPEFAILT